MKSLFNSIPTFTRDGQGLTVPFVAEVRSVGGKLESSDTWFDGAAAPWFLPDGEAARIQGMRQSEGGAYLLTAVESANNEVPESARTVST